LASIIFLAANGEAVEHAVKVALSFLHIDILP
jgi:hypothetical protein